MTYPCYRLSWAILITSVFLACNPDDENKEGSFKQDHKPKEYKLNEIPLKGEVGLREAELSGLTWYKDYLIILPQYPFKHKNSNEGKIFAISKKRITDFIDGENTDSLLAKEIKFSAKGLGRFNRYGSGYEAITFNGDDVYLTIESIEEDSTMMGYVVKGKIKPDLSEIILDESTLTKTEPQTGIHNLADETIIIFENKIFAIYEAYGKNINNNPVVHVFDLNLNPLPTQVFPNIEYRLTDATTPDKSGKFWAVNYFYPGDEKELNPATDLEFKKFGRGETHSKFKVVERLVEFQITGTSIARTKSPPLQLELYSDKKGRNWEGIAYLKNRGFLIVSDYFPETLMGYVKIVE